MSEWSRGSIPGRGNGQPRGPEERARGCVNSKEAERAVWAEHRTQAAETDRAQVAEGPPGHNTISVSAVTSWD